ncbi:hypothetical protein EK21DRAFT_113445 [Setomelanomma holmii]|uniref:Uncharacterized protein n=1 Tax=Setomelanomma holmii TaxID=210430 RepID=A0A9P4H8L6_9PLEO|nr:hypothetical protein EK21DRAFT_113445 [Setomelanomma holmii]
MANPDHPQTHPARPDPTASGIASSLSTTSLNNNANPWNPAVSSPTAQLRRYWKDFCAAENEARRERGELAFCNNYQRDRAFEKLLRLEAGTEKIEWSIWSHWMSEDHRVEGYMRGGGGSDGVESGESGVGLEDGADESEGAQLRRQLREHLQREQQLEEQNAKSMGLDGEGVGWYRVEQPPEANEELDKEGGLMMAGGREKGTVKGWRKDSKDVNGEEEEVKVETEGVDDLRTERRESVDEEYLTAHGEIEREC